MSIKRIFIVISAIFAASAVFADNSSVTSKKYVDDLMSGYQGKLPGSGANTLMIYDNSEDGIGEKAIAATLGNSASATSVPTVGAVKTGLDGKQDTITGTAGYVMTGTGTPGEVGEKPIYSANTNYTDSLVTAETVNTGVINAVNSSLIRVNENGAADSNGTLWKISDDLWAINANVPYGYTELQYVDMNSGSYLLTDIVPTYDSKVEMDFQTKSVGSTNRYMGGRTVTYGGLFLTSTTSSFVVDAFGTTADDRYTSSVAPANYTHYKFIYDNQVATLTSGNSTLFTNTFTGTNANGAALAINALNNNGTIQADPYGIYLYSFKVWNPTGQLVANYVPATYNNTVGFYDTVSKTFKTATSGTFTAGPSCISPNLFNINSSGVVANYYMSSDGSLAQSTSWNVSDYIPIKENETFTYSTTRPAGGLGSGAYLAYYGANYAVISTEIQGTSTNKTFTTPAGTAYIKVSFGNTGNWQVELGSAATTYRPYGQNICD